MDATCFKSIKGKEKAPLYSLGGEEDFSKLKEALNIRKIRIMESRPRSLDVNWRNISFQ